MTIFKIRATKAEETLSALEPEHIKLNKRFNNMLEENEILVIKVEEVCMERDEMRRILLEGGDESLLKAQRSSSVLRDSAYLNRPATPKRSEEDIDRHVKKFEAEINEEVQLTRANEKIYMGKFEDLISGKTKSIGPDQADALLGIRYEFLRRELTIKMIIGEMKKVQRDMFAMKTELE